MVRKRGGVYQYRFRWTVKNPDGTKEHYRIERPAKNCNKTEARALEADHKKALKEGKVRPSDPFPATPPPVAKVPTPMTLREYADVVICHVALRRKARTAQFYRECVERIERFPRLALAPLDSVKSGLIEAYVDWRLTNRKGNSAWAINGELRTLSRILRFAEEKELITKAPAIHMLEGCRGRDRTVSLKDEATYLAKASGDLADAAIIGVETGLRPDSELFLLKWENVTSTGIRVMDGKTDAATRIVPLSPRAKAILEARQSLAKGSPYVFPSPTSKSGHLMTLKKPHYRACREAGLKRFPIYTWRHTFGTRCAESGVDKYTLARWMGHSSPSVTARYYVHISERHELAGFEQFVEHTERLRAEAFRPASESVQ
jgi:integrase